MNKGTCLLLGLCASSCSAHELVPSLSLHAVLVLQRRDQEQIAQAQGLGRGRDFSLTARLGFGGARPGKRDNAGELEPLPQLAAQSTPACEEIALCEWARMAEESALAALGVSP
jgi:hypothetical protein